MTMPNWCGALKSATAEPFVRSCSSTIAGFTGSPDAFCVMKAKPRMDVVQEAYVRAFTHLETFRGDSSLRTWLARITMNEALGRLRRQRQTVDWTTLETNRTEAQIIQFPLSTTSDDPERTMEQQEIQHLVEQAIDDLPEAYRIVFITRVIEEMSVQETADLFALRPETVKTRLHRARRLLRDQLEKQIGPVLMDAFPFAGQRCERMTEAVVRRLGLGG